MNQVAPSTRKLMKLAANAIEKHRGQEAMNLLRQVLTLNPNHAEAYHNIGYILHSAGHYNEASQHYQRAIQADPNYVESYLWLCKLLEAQGRGDEAIKLAARATEIEPNNPKTHGEFVTQLTRFNNAHLVPAYLEGLLPRFPKELSLLQHYTFALKVNERHAEADAVYKKMIAEHRVPANYRFVYETYLPRLNQSQEEIDAGRATFQASLEKFLVEKPRIAVELISFLPTFQLAFHNRDNKELAKLYIRTLRAISPEVNFTAPHCKVALAERSGPIKVGFVSRHMYKHSVGSCYRNVMIRLSQNPDFSVTFFNVAHVMDEKIQEIIDAGVPIVSLPKMLESAQKVIAEKELDILVYPDIGMDAMTHYLAMARLARYQCCLTGHPDTTGIETIDYLMSSWFYEPENGPENYTEQLLRPKTIDTIFARSKPPERWLSRAELQLPEGKKLYVCPMAIQKFHPDYDRFLADILARDPEAVLVLFSDFQQQAMSDTLRARIHQHCDPARVVFLPWLPLETLFSVLKTADAVLDTLYFGGGTTIQYCFSFGIPVVSMPGTQARGRMVHAYYAMMGVNDAPLAQDKNAYVTQALRVAHDSAYKQALSQEILDKNHMLDAGSPYSPKLEQVLSDMMAQTLDAYR